MRKLTISKIFSYLSVIKKVNKMTIYIDIKKDEQSIFTSECNPRKPIKDLKEIIKKTYGIPVYCQKLYYKKIELSDDKYFSDYNIKATDEINYQGRSMLNFINLEKLKTILYNPNKKIGLIYYLKASDSILDLKQIISKENYIPIDKIQILKDNKIIDDKILLEDYIHNLKFELNLLEMDKIKIILVDENNEESTIYINPISTVYETICQIGKNFDIRLSYNDIFLNLRRLLIQYNIKNNDCLKMIKSKGIIDLNLDDCVIEQIKADLDEKVSEIKEYISSLKENYDFDLVIKGRYLNGNKKLSELKIHNGDKIRLLFPVLGG